MTLLLAYARERLLIPPVLAAVILVAGGSQVVRFESASGLARDLLLAGLFVAAFRIWDDIADRGRDRREHPDRVMVRAQSVLPLICAAVLMWTAAAALTVLVSGWGTAALLGAYTVALGVWYRTRPPAGLGIHLILAKYAAFTVAIIGSERFATPRGASVVALVYLAACIYEWAHDAAAPVVGGVR